MCLLSLDPTRNVYGNYIRIPSLKDLPEVAHRAEWSRLLRTDYSTLYRAHAGGNLKGHRSKTGSVTHTKKQILEWLGIEVAK
jgi:hypothetical protein